MAQDRTYTVITAERSQRQENKILETLAFIEGKGDLSIAAFAGAHARLFPKGSTVILLTPTTADEILLVVDDLQRRGLRPVVVLLAAETFGGGRGTARIAGRLQEAHVPLRLVECGADVGETLSGLLAPTSSQESTAWQRPTLSHLI